MVRKKFGLLGSRKQSVATGGDGAAPDVATRGRKGGTAVPRTSASGKPPLFASLVRGRSKQQRPKRAAERSRLVEEGSEASDDPHYDDSYSESFAGRRAAAAKVRETTGMDIWTACQVGDVAYCAATVERYPEFIHLEQRGRTPLFHACNHDHVAIAAMLLEAGATDLDSSCYQAATSPVLKNLLLQYKAVEDELESTAATEDDAHSASRAATVASSDDRSRSFPAAATAAFNWEVGSLASASRDEFSLFGGESQSHFSRPIETPLREGRDEDEPSGDASSASSDTKEEAASSASSSGDDDGDDASCYSDVDDPKEAPSDEKDDDDELNENFSHDMEEELPQDRSIEEQEPEAEAAVAEGPFEAKPSEHFEIVIQKKKKKRSWLPKKIHLNKKRSGPLEIVESHSGSAGDGEEGELYSKDIVGASFESMESAGAAFGTSFESDDFMEEKPATDPELKAAALASAAATAATSIATSAADETYSTRIETVKRSPRWLPKKLHKMKRPVKIVQSSQRSPTPPLQNDEVYSEGVIDTVESKDTVEEDKPVAEADDAFAEAAKAVDLIATGAAETEQEATRIETVRKNSRWLTLKNKMGRSSSKVIPASSSLDQAEDRNPARWSTCNSAPSSRSGTPTNQGTEIMPSEDEATNEDQESVSSQDSNKPVGSVGVLADLEKTSKGSLAEVAQWFFAKPNAQLAAAEDVSLAKHSISTRSDGGVEVRDKTVATRAVPTPVTEDDHDSDDASADESKESKAVSLASKAASIRSKASRLSGSSSRASEISAAEASEEMSKLSNEVAKTFPAFAGDDHQRRAAQSSPTRSVDSVEQQDDRSVCSAHSQGSKRSWVRKELFTENVSDDDDDEHGSSIGSTDRQSSSTGSPDRSVDHSVSVGGAVAAAGVAVSARPKKEKEEVLQNETQETQSESDIDEEQVEVTLEDFGAYSLVHKLERQSRRQVEKIRVAREKAWLRKSAAVEDENSPDRCVSKGGENKADDAHPADEDNEDDDVSTPKSPPSILRNKEAKKLTSDDEDEDEEYGPRQKSRVDSQLSRFAQSFSSSCDYNYASEEEDILNNKSSMAESDSMTPSGEGVTEEESTSSGEEYSEEEDSTDGDETDTDEENYSDIEDDLETCKTSASDATGFQLMGAASSVLVHPGDTFKAISAEISCILGKGDQA